MRMDFDNMPFHGLIMDQKNDGTHIIEKHNVYFKLLS